MPQGSEKSQEKNHNEIRHSLCKEGIKSWQSMKKMTQKIPQIVKKTVHVNNVSDI